MRRGLLLSLVFAAACNQVFDIQKSESTDADRDGDLVLTAFDNCPDTANADQADADRDGHGDVCDGCPGVMNVDNHDEDGDRRADPCDSCPTIADFPVDTDGDGVGEACDFQDTASSRIAFDAFTTLDESWQTFDMPWRIVGDSVAPADRLTASDRGLQQDRIRLFGVSWWVRAGFTTRSRWQPQDSFGVVMRDATTAEPLATCMLACATTCALTLAIPGRAPAVKPAIDPLPIVRLVMRAGSDASGPMVDCKFEGTTHHILSRGAPTNTAGVPSLVASPTIPLSFVEVAQHDVP